ncbi:MAG: PfkB family carbohydrate kinase [Verrucomicrobiota bacterium]
MKAESPKKGPDVLCVGLAVWDLNYTITAHPKTDEKIRANNLSGCGGGPASNAAVQIVKLNGAAVFAGRVGNDGMGELIAQDLRNKGVNTAGLCWTHEPSAVATILVKPDGSRTVIAPPPSRPIPPHSVSLKEIEPKVLLIDGHEPELSESLAEEAKVLKIPTILDAGSRHTGTQAIWKDIEILAASEKFARQITSETEPNTIFEKISKLHCGRACIVTFGEYGLIYSENGGGPKHLRAFPVKAIDTNGAGDAFHGALALALARGHGLDQACIYASAAGALTVTKPGARTALPNAKDLATLL